MAVADFAQGVTDSNYWASHLFTMHPAAKTADASSNGDGKSFFENVLDVVNPLQHLPVVGTIYRAVTGDKIGTVEKLAGDALYGGVVGFVSSLADMEFQKLTGKNLGDTMLAMVGIGDKSTEPTTALASNAASPKTSTPASEQAEVAKTAELNKAALKPSQTTQLAQAATATPAQIGTQRSPAPTFVTAITMATAATAATPATTKTTTIAAVAKAAPSQTPIDISPQTDALLASLQRNGVTGAMQTQALDAYRRTMTMGAQTTTVQ